MLNVVRNPWSAYADTKKRAVPLSLAHYVLGWTVHLQHALAFADRFRGRVHILRYEDLVADPRGALRDVLGRMGIGDSPTLSSPSWNGQPLREVYPWGTIRTPTPEANQKTAAELSPEEHEEVRRARRSPSSVLWATPDRRPTGERVLVTGAAGFIGAGAVRRLLDRGFAVEAVVHPQSDPWRLRGLSVPVHTLDLADADAVRRRSWSRCARTGSCTSPPTGVPLAGGRARHRREQRPRQLPPVPGGGAGSVRLLVNAGSSSEYGYRDEPMRGGGPARAEQRLRGGQGRPDAPVPPRLRGDGVPMVTFRLFSVYGPWEEPRRLVPTAIRRARAGEPLEMVATRHRPRLRVRRGRARRPHRLRPATATIGARSSTSGAASRPPCGISWARSMPRSECGPRSGGARCPPRRWDATCWQADVSKSARLLGWTPRHGLVEGLRATARWMVDHAAA